MFKEKVTNTFIAFLMCGGLFYVIGVLTVATIIYLATTYTLFLIILSVDRKLAQKEKPKRKLRRISGVKITYEGGTMVEIQMTMDTRILISEGAVNVKYSYLKGASE